MSLRAILFFTALNILNYMDRYLMAAVLPSVSVEFALSQAQAGWIFSAFVPGYVLFSPLFGYLGDRYNRPKLMCMGVLLWSCATLATALAPNFWLLLVARVAVGIGEASFATIAPGYLKDKLHDPIKLNTALAIFYASIPVGSALGYVIGGQSSQQLSWHAAFYCGAIPGLLLPWFLLRFKEVEGRCTSNLSVLSGLRSISQIHVLRYVFIGYILNAFALNGIASFVTTYGKEIGFQIDQIGVAFGVVLVAAGFLGTFAGGRLASSLASRSSDPLRFLLKYAGVTGLLGTPFVALAFVTSDHFTFLALCFFAELAIFAAMAPINSLLVSACPASLVTLTQGAAIFSINLFGAFPAPPMVGFVADTFSLSIGLQLLSLALLFSGLVWTFGSRLSNLRQS